MIKSLIISPHMDDAFLCLGGYILSRFQKEQIEVIDVFSFDPWTIDEKGDKKKRILIRKAEERSNSKIVNIPVHFWDYPAAWKERGYSCWDDKINFKKDCELIKEIELKIKMILINKNIQRLYFPLGIGGHIDHKILYSIGLQLNSIHCKTKIFFYEDLPYALNQNFWCKADIFSLKNIKSKEFNISKYLNKKRRILETYCSQLTLKEIELVIDFNKNPQKFVPSSILSLIDSKSRVVAKERLWTVNISK